MFLDRCDPCICRYTANLLGYQPTEETIERRVVSVEGASINRCAARFLLLIEKMACKRKRSVGCSWRIDETYIGVKGVWKYLYRVFDKAMTANGALDKVRAYRSGANKAAIDAINAGRDVPIVVREVKYRNNIVEQDHRAI